MCESVEEVELKIQEDNRARCDFFKHFQYDENKIMGSVSHLKTPSNIH